MSFFGFDPSKAHNPSGSGFAQALDPFAGLSQHGNADDDALDFEDTYDGLGDQLDETDDAFNDDTFGGGGGGGGGDAGNGSIQAPRSVGKDFDFHGQTAKVADAIEEEQLWYSRQAPPSRFGPGPAQYPSTTYAQPAKSGYERYKDPDYLRDLQADESIWGGTIKKNIEDTAAREPVMGVPAGRKMMSLEEVEAAMRAQAKKPPQSQDMLPPSSRAEAQDLTQPLQAGQPQQFPPQEPRNMHQQEYMARSSAQQPEHVTQRQQTRNVQHQPVYSPVPPAQPQIPQQPIRILQNPNRLSGQNQVNMPNQINTQPQSLSQPPGSSNRPPNSAPLHPHQLAGLSEDERLAYVAEDAKRAKRNHKIFLLSKNNGLMTPQDKNFITRIQLQQLVTATGDPNEHGIDSMLAEDFYYQVHNQIRGGPRQNPNQPLSNFAQTYLFQTGGRHGGNRRQNRGGDSHVQRMEQQVQRAVEAAKNKPKNKQLVIEGSLGKISFSNAKTPKPLLNIKRTDSSSDVQRPSISSRNTIDKKTQPGILSGDDRKTVLRSIEKVYDVLMRMEDHDRQIPPPLDQDDVNPRLVGLHMDWQAESDRLNATLWQELKVHEPVGATATHPFIAFLSFAKGKRAIPRVFRYINQEQRTTILTIIAVHLDQLDVIRQAILLSGDAQLNSGVRENVELFSLTVMPSLFTYLNEAELNIVDGVLGIILAKTSVEVVARTRIGVSMLTMILSRAELIKEAGSSDESMWNHWLTTYNAFFDALESTLPFIFPGTVNTGEDIYVWQFLAAIGIGAGPEQQQRLVMAVKDRVMETVALAKTLPPDMSSQRLANVNLFMRSIGLDVELLA